MFKRFFICVYLVCLVILITCPVFICDQKNCCFA